MSFDDDFDEPPTRTTDHPMTTTPLGTTTYAYAATGALRSITDASDNALVASYSRDADGLLTSAGAMEIVREAASGEVASTTLGAVQTVEQTSAHGELSSRYANYQGAILYSEEMLARDAVGRITQRRELLDGITTLYGYQYDAAGRLAAVTVDGAQAVQYTYDENGNRTARTTPGGGANDSCQYDDQDRLLACGGTRYAHNAVGQLTEKTLLETGATTRYDYDVFGNLRVVTLPDTRRIDYDIDGQNRRIGKRVNGVRGWGLLYQTQLAPIAQLDADNRVVSTFVYGTHKHVPDYMVKGGVTYRFVVDHLGSVRMVVNVADGSVAQRMEYDEYGRVLGDTNPGWQPFGFAGGLYDADTGLVRFGARDYDASVGRWTARDPILFGGGQENLYVYVNGDSVNQSDANGLGPELLCLIPGLCPAVIAAAAAAAELAAEAIAAICIGVLLSEAQTATPCKFVREVYWTGKTKTCMYACPGQTATFMQCANKPCFPIGTNGLVDTTGAPRGENDCP